MLTFLLLAASLLPSQQAVTECADTGAVTATAQTQPVRGPGGVTTVLAVSTADDHGKNSHECNADYQLFIIPASGGTPKTVGFLASDGDWGRKLSLRLDGFSADGKHVFGILTESGKYPTSLMFDYDVSSDGAVQLLDLNMKFARILPPACTATFGVIGTTQAGGVVLELDSANPCGSSPHWKVDSSAGKPQALPPNATFSSLYGFKPDMQ